VSWLRLEGEQMTTEEFKQLFSYREKLLLDAAHITMLLARMVVGRRLADNCDHIPCTDCYRCLVCGGND
jgi:hypothetical protein